MRLTAAGYSSSRAMSEYGVVYGMVMPVLMVPSTLIGSLALVLVPELSECYYKGNKEKLSALVEKALNTTLLIAAALIPFYIVCGESVGVFLYSNAASGQLIRNSALILLPMSITMICTSILNSLGCERQTLIFFLFGSAAMLLCVWVLPEYLGSGALLVGMACDYVITAVCSLVLLSKKTGKLRSGKYLLKLALSALPVIAAGILVRNALTLWLGYLPALGLSLLFVAVAEIALFQLLKLFDFRTLLGRFFTKKPKKMPARD